MQDLRPPGDEIQRVIGPGLHFHDLRYAGNTIKDATRVNTRDLVARMGHDSMNAVIIYQHATRPTDRVIANALAVQISNPHCQVWAEFLYNHVRLSYNDIGG